MSIQSQTFLTNNPIYIIWDAMIQRCNNKNNIAFKDYGGRGIQVCERWHKSYNFIDDMYPSYQEGLSIDRIDVNGNYEPSNCRWTTRQVQQRNTRVIRKSNTSGYRGVSFDKSKGLFFAQIMINYKTKFLGYGKTPLECAKKYDNFVKENNLEHSINGV